MTFSEPVTAATATVTGNYTFSPAVAVTAATLSADGYQVTLTTRSQALNTLYTLTVANVKDTAGIPLRPAPRRRFTSVSLLKGYAFYERWKDANGDLGDLAGLTAAVAAGDLRSPDVAGIVSSVRRSLGRCRQLQCARSHVLHSADNRQLCILRLVGRLLQRLPEHG